MYGPTTAALLAEGAIAGLWDGRSGHWRDLSGNGNHGTMSAGMRQTGPAGSWVFPAVTDEVTVADAPSLRLTAGSIVAVSERGFTSQVSNEYICGNRSGGLGYDFRIRAADLAFDGDATTSVGGGSVLGAKSIGVAFANGAKPIGYKDGISLGAFSINSAVTATAAALDIGNWRDLGRTRSPLSAVLLSNRILTPAEMLAVHNELVRKRWPSKQRARAQAGGADNEVQFKTDWGYPISAADEGGVTGQQIGGHASPFRAGDATGRWRVETDTVDGKTCKAVVCKTAGKINVPASLFGLGTTPTEAAYGTFDLYAYKADSSVFDANLIATIGTGITTGYGIKWAADESVVLTEYGVGNVVAGGTASHSAWHRFRVTRTIAGLFTLYIDGAAIGTGTDVTLTTSQFMTFDMDAGDKLALSDVGGGHSLMKQLGVVTP